jgi:hypothetical protein
VQYPTPKCMLLEHAEYRGKTFSNVDQGLVVRQDGLQHQPDASMFATRTTMTNKAKHTVAFCNLVGANTRSLENFTVLPCPSLDGTALYCAVLSSTVAWGGGLCSQGSRSNLFLDWWTQALHQTSVPNWQEQWPKRAPGCDLEANAMRLLAGAGHLP